MFTKITISKLHFQSLKSLQMGDSPLKTQKKVCFFKKANHFNKNSNYEGKKGENSTLQ